MDIATGAALIILGFTAVIGCIWVLRREYEQQRQELETHISFEV